MDYRRFILPCTEQRPDHLPDPLFWHGTNVYAAAELVRTGYLSPGIDGAYEDKLFFAPNVERHQKLGISLPFDPHMAVSETGRDNCVRIHARMGARMWHMRRLYGDRLPKEFYTLLSEIAFANSLRLTKRILKDEVTGLEDIIAKQKDPTQIRRDLKEAFTYRGVLITLKDSAMHFNPKMAFDDRVSTEIYSTEGLPACYVQGILPLSQTDEILLLREIVGGQAVQHNTHAAKRHRRCRKNRAQKPACPWK
ncbi:hypothetical protein J4457_07495 [Candidatus Woesearchaeota archaeon]|nr:hypothetical protein [Candidatus Woesearchaeota archaeon]